MRHMMARRLSDRKSCNTNPIQLTVSVTKFEFAHFSPIPDDVNHALKKSREEFSHLVSWVGL